MIGVHIREQIAAPGPAGLRLVRKILTFGEGFTRLRSVRRFQQSGAREFDLGGGFHYSGSYPMELYGICYFNIVSAAGRTPL